MTALSADRNTPRREGGSYRRPVAAGVKIYIGALVVLDNAGFAHPGHVGLGLIADGRAEIQIDNTLGAAGAVAVPVRAGNFVYANSAGGDAITAANIGAPCYIVDDQTVALTNGGGGGAATRSPAGTILDIDSTGVTVAVGLLHL